MKKTYPPILTNFFKEKTMDDRRKARYVEDRNKRIQEAVWKSWKKAIFQMPINNPRYLAGEEYVKSNRYDE